VVEDKYVDRLTKGMIDATIEKYRRPGDKVKMHIPTHTKVSQEVAEYARKRAVEIERIYAHRGKKVIFH